MSNRLTMLIVLATTLFIGGCAWFDNQTTYFNTYYNIRRITIEIEDEIAFKDELKRAKPRLFVPAIEGVEQGSSTAAGNTFQFLKAFVVERATLQPVATKVDSILLKGSKILANHPKSDYVEGTLFHMAKAYFFRSEFLPSQQKCLELVELFPGGDFSPDAHLLLAKDYLLQRKVSQGVQALSRCVDVAWYKDRYDILSEAYRIQAEIALEQGEVDKAIQPYKQAVEQTDVATQKAAWQVEVGGIYYRTGRYDLAEKAFATVFQYTPEPVAEFEALLYRGASLARLGKFDEAERIFEDLENDRKFEEWSSFISAERLALERLRKPDAAGDAAIIAQEKKADTSFIGRPELMAQAFQKGMDLYKKARYSDALPYFAKAKVVRTPIFEVASKYFTLIKQWEDGQQKYRRVKRMPIDKPALADSVHRMRAREAYALGRVHEQMGNLDSAMLYFREAYDSTSTDDAQRAQYLYGQVRLLRDTDPDAADSIAELVAERFPDSEFGRQAHGDLGYTADPVIDDAAELYRSANSFRMIRDYGYADKRYNDVVARFPDSEWSPKSLYMLGWMYEREAGNLDSAIYYYGQLVERYPRSDYAKEIRPSLEFALAKRNGQDLNDSLLLNDLDDALLKRAKAGEKGALQQMIDNNKDAVGLKAGGMSLPGIPGSSDSTRSGTGAPGVDALLKQQLQNLPRINGAGGATIPMTPAPQPQPADTTSTGTTPVRKP